MAMQRRIGERTGAVVVFAILWVFYSASLTAASVPHFDKFGPLQSPGAWQLPDGPVRKVLVIFEGSGIYPNDFWERSSECPFCNGLPENRKLVEDALALNYAVFVPKAITDTDPAHPGNWLSWPVDNPETQNILVVLSEWKSAHGLEGLPMVGLGTSAGGDFISTLALIPDLFESIAIMISHGIVEAVDAAPSSYPPTIFIHMPKDADTAALVTDARRTFESKGIRIAEKRWYEHPVTVDWFADAVPEIDHGLSNAIYDGLKRDGWLENGTDILTSDLFHGAWDSLVTKLNLPKDPNFEGKFMFQDAVFQEMNVAYAQHVTFARLDTEIFGWFEGDYDVVTNNLASS